MAASLPVLTMIALLPVVLYKLFPPGVTATPEAPLAAREALRTMGPLTRNEWVVAVVFGCMVTGWVMAGTLNLSLAAIAFAGLGALLATNVLGVDDINLQGATLVTFLWLAVLFALSGQLNELGFMGYVGARLTVASWRSRLAADLHHSAGPLRIHALHVCQPERSDSGSLRRLSWCRSEGRSACSVDGICAVVCEQLLLDHYTARGKSECDFRRKRLSDPGRTLPSWAANHTFLPAGVFSHRNAVAAFRRAMMSLSVRLRGPLAGDSLARSIGNLMGLTLSKRRGHIHAPPAY